MSDIDDVNAMQKAHRAKRMPADGIAPMSVYDLIAWLRPVAKAALEQADQEVQQVGAILSTLVMSLESDDKALIAAIANTAKMVSEYQLDEENG